MNDKRRVGRPKGPEKVVFKAYLKPVDKELLQKVGVGSFLKWAAENMEGGVFPAMGDCVRADYVQTPPSKDTLEELEPHAKRIVQPLLDDQLKVEREKYKREVVSLLEIGDKLTRERDYWKGRFDGLEAAPHGESGDVLALKKEVAVLKAKIKEYEQMYG